MHFVIEYFFLLGFVLLTSYGFTQDCTELTWQTGERLEIEDFCIKVENNKSHPSFAQFNIGYQTPGFGMFSNNFNKKVTNNLIRNASWIDTSVESIEESIQYQQILFDLAEVYCRQFRKELLIEKKRIALDVQYVKEINSRIMSLFSKKRAEFEVEFSEGDESFVMAKWEKWITSELANLAQFDYDNTKRIHLE